MISKISTKIATQAKKVGSKASNFASQIYSLPTRTLESDVFINSKVDEKFTSILERGFEFIQGLKIKKAKATFEKIEFQPAKTLEEALEYSKKLGITELHLGENQTLEVLNYLNEGFTRFRNVHLGLAEVPCRVIYEPNGDSNLMSAVSTLKMFKVNENVYGISAIDASIKKKIEEILECFCDETENGVEIPEFYSTQKEIEYIKKMFDEYRRNPNSFDYGGKIELLTILDDFIYNMTEFVVEPKNFAKRLFSKAGILTQCSPEKKQAYLDRILNAPTRQGTIGELARALAETKESFQLQTTNKKFTNLFHEMGHLQDYFYDRAPAKGKFSNPDEYPKALRLWLDDEEKQGIAFSVSNYATSGPGEFIAETYSKLLTGEDVSEAVRSLYTQMHGPKIPNII